MKQILLATTALVIAGQALAAERTYSWTGCYVGGHIGQGRTNTQISEPDESGISGTQYFAPVGTSIGVGDTGTLGGVQAGCDYQFAQNWLVGAGGDFSWANINGQAADPFFAGKSSGSPILLNSKTDRLGTLTGRVGYVRDRVLFYGKGGVAWVHNNHSIENLTFWGNPVSNNCFAGGFVACNPSGAQTRSGWTIGAGVEWAFASQWSVGIEYNHYDFGTYAVTLTDANGAAGAPLSGPVNVKQTIEAVRLSLNYRFAPLGSH